MSIWKFGFLVCLDFIGIVESENNLQKDLSFLIDKKFAVNSISLSLIGRFFNKNSVDDLDRYKKAFYLT